MKRESAVSLSPVEDIVAEGFDSLDAPIRRLTGAFCPTPYSPPLEAVMVPQPKQIADAIRQLIAE